MNARLCLIMTCLLLSACQTQRERFTSIWSPAEVVEDASAHPADYNQLLDNPLGQPHDNGAEINDPNKLLTLTDVSGNREYLILDRISQERGILTAIIEFRYVKPQTLPANGMTYHYNQWREQIDCKNKVRILRNTTHYNMAGEIVDTIDYPLPKFKPAELAALSQPNDKVIQQVCERAGETGLAVGDATIAGTTDDKTKSTANKADKKADKADQSVEQSSTQAKNKNKKDATKKSDQTKADAGVKVDEKIDFISKGKAESASAPAAPTDTSTPPAVEKTDDAPAAKPADTSDQDKKAAKKSSKKDKKGKKDQKDQSTDKAKPDNQSDKQNAETSLETNAPAGNDDVEVLEGEVQLKPI